MRRHIIHIVILLFTAILQLLSAFSQNVTLNFTCRDASNQYVQLKKVVVSNLTKGWEETIWWPDTTLILQNGTGIQNIDQPAGFYLTQNIPNPFDGKTEVTLFTDDEGETTLSIFDLNGSLVSSYSQKLEKGFHQFSIQLAAAQSYLLTASNNGCRSSIKMVNSGGGSDNSIKYLGLKNDSYPVKGSSDKPFSFGDMMQYVGYGWVNHTETESNPISQVQNSSQTITLYIPFSLPTVVTMPVSDITASSAVCGGIVTSDGNDSVTDRGIFWNTSQNPSMDDDTLHLTVDGSGMGSFTSILTGLNAGTTYYVRAYATNNAGIAYGAQQSFTTLALLPTVTTLSVTNISSNSATCGGNITSDGGASITSRGVCWSTSQNPTVDDNHTTDGGGTGSFYSSITGLTAGTIYYVRAYAINSLGIEYGEQQSFTTLASLPTVTTLIVTNISSNSATCGGIVTSDGGAPVTLRGVCWSTSQNPIVEGFSYHYTIDGSGMGSFTSNVSDLCSTTTYYIRAYAINSAGIAYGEQQTFTTTIPVQLPTVSTDAISNITPNSASCGGNVTSDGGATITARGVCWSTSHNPTVIDNHTADGSGSGNFTSSITGLTAGTTYYVRAYAVNSAGTSYGEQQCFLASYPQDGLPCPGTLHLTDYDGNTYNTIQIGNQCWMKESLRTTHYEDGESIYNGIGTGSSSNLSMAKYYDPVSDATGHTFGYLYNYRAAIRNFSSSSTNPSGVQGICPNGWHMPSIAEVWQLRHYLETQINALYIAKSLASTESWSGCTYEGTPGNSPNENNASGFSALSAGAYYNGDFYSFGQSVRFWSSVFNSNASYFGFTNDSHTISTDQTDRARGFSVRCILDPDSSSSAPTVTTSSVTNINFTSATCGGYVTSYSGEAVTTRGVCWSISPNPTVNDSHTTDGDGTGSFISSITGLTAGTTYYVRAYITNSIGITSYGYEKLFQTSPPPPQVHPCPNAETMTDYDGNIYNTVQLGNQCWMKENLRTTHYSDGTIILLYPGSSTGGSSTAYRYYPNNDSSNVSTYGFLYNWKAVMNNSASSYTNPSFVQGVCPIGWHVPSISEWALLKYYVSMESIYICGDNNNDYNHYTISKALASTIGWNTSTALCTPGNNPDDNNATGFSAMPAGSGFTNFGQKASFWSTSEKNNDESQCFNISELYALASYVSKNGGLSVRCVRDSSTVALPSVTTDTVSNITISTAICGGNVTANGGVNITSRGVCWSTSQNPSVSNSHTTDGSGMGCFTSNLFGLASNATYYVRAYATNSAGIAYGNEVYFTTFSDSTIQDGLPCFGTPTITDIDGNIYNTVQIGQQCWMKENLRTTKYADGTPISTSNNISFDIPYWYYPNNDSLNKQTYGLMYNWKALMRNSTSSNSVPSDVQGICPTGWHVPSHAEWTQLTDHVENQSQFVCGSNSHSIAKALADTTGWNISTNMCSPGNNPSENNATGFSARPAGYEFTFALGHNTTIWSATSDSGNSGLCRDISAINSSVSVSYCLMNRGHSVRCVKN